MAQKSVPLLGTHLSIAHGYMQTIHDAQMLDCNAIQMFTHSARSWNAKNIAPDEKKEFIAEKHKLGLTVISHASYLINIGSPKSATLNHSQALLSKELEYCHELAIPYLVLHPGACLESDITICINQIAQTLDHVLSTHTGNTMILLENMAGQGSTIGARFEELAEIRQRTHHKKRIGFCLDTCHAFSAGYAFDTKKNYENFMGTIDKTIGIDHIKIIHINDSATPYDSHKDRHEHIGKGTIPLLSFSLIMNDQRFSTIPKILETPKDANFEFDKKNLTLLRSLIQ
jgi:deoxyribonuclease-4